MTILRPAALCLAAALGAVGLASAPAAAQPKRAAQDDQELDARRKEAREYFEKGLTLFDQRRWEDAVAEFQRSRRTLPNRSATKYAASCLRELRRYDEALEMFEEVRTFPNLSADDAKFADEGIAELKTRTGVLYVEGGEAGASIVVDGRYRGTLPLPGPIRVSAGTHDVGAFKQGLDPFGAAVEVKGGQQAVAQLRSRSTGGRLKVSEQHGLALEVLVDDTPVGKTPWEGQVAAGDHLVRLEGSVDIKVLAACAPGAAAGASGNVELGTQPVSVPIHKGELTKLTLTAEDLSAYLRVEPTPGGGSVVIDSVMVGHGTWEGRLRAGTHKVEVMADGFLTESRSTTLEARKRRVLAIALARDWSTPLWRTTRNAAAGASFGIGAVGLGTAAVTGFLAYKKVQDVKSRCGTTCPLSEKSNLDAASTLGTLSTAGLVLGGVGVLGGSLVLALARPGAKERQTAGVTYHLGPGSFAIGGSF
ncbi:MAG: tetratricopeptide repeat protein [Minicystis sp.]